jgi:hypothetical protein
VTDPEAVVDAATDDQPAGPGDAPKYRSLDASTHAGEFRCPDCGNRVTRSPTGVEYGHERGSISDGPREQRCPRRPATVDPARRDRP